MLETALLIKVGMVIKGIVWGGYGLAGGYGVRTAVQYVADYKDAIAREKEMK